MRGIEKNMPFIRKVHLVVARESQVPEWVNRNEVNIVLHKDIIPAKHLPTFNCNPIEMHLHRIEGLDEEYIYFNDDIFPLKPCKATDFFIDGRATLGMSRHLFAFNMFKKICRNSNRIARKAIGLKPSVCFLRPQHICTPMLKSQCEELYQKVETEIISSLTKTRSSNNLNQYMFLDYMYLRGMLINKRMSKKHFSLGVASEDKIRKYIQSPKHSLVCINDVQMSEESYNEIRRTLLNTFEQVLPEKSRFEL